MKHEKLLPVCFPFLFAYNREKIKSLIERFISIRVELIQNRRQPDARNAEFLLTDVQVSL